MSHPDNNAPTLNESLLPMPGVTERKKTPPKEERPKPKARPRKLLSEHELAVEGDRLMRKYPHLDPTSLQNATKDQPTEGFTPEEVTKYRHKRSCIIKCQNAGCSWNRRIATSDLAQVKLCEDCTRIARNARKRERRANAKAQKEE